MTPTEDLLGSEVENLLGSIEQRWSSIRLPWTLPIWENSWFCSASVSYWTSNEAEDNRTKLCNAVTSLLFERLTSLLGRKTDAREDNFPMQISLGWGINTYTSLANVIQV